MWQYFFVIVLDQKLLKHTGKDIKQSPLEKIVSFSDVYIIVETKLKELVMIYARAGQLLAKYTPFVSYCLSDCKVRG